MKRFFTLLPLAVCVLLPLARAGGGLTRSYHRSYPAPGELVVLDVARGVIEVSNGAEGSAVEFTVEQSVERVTPAAGGAAEATASEGAAKEDAYAALFSRLEPRYRQDEKQLCLEVTDSRGVVFDWDPALRMVIVVKVAVPPGTALKIVNQMAGVTVADGFAGNVEIRSEGGSIFAQTVRGDLIARTDTGSITVSEVTGRSELRSESGLVLAGRLRGPADLRTSTGSVEVQHAYDALKIRGDHADIVLGLSQPLPKSVDLKTSAGAITVNIDENLPVSLDASTGMLGAVKVRGLAQMVKRDGRKSSSSLVADLNGGGLVAKVRTSGGGIALIGREPIDG